VPFWRVEPPCSSWDGTPAVCTIFQPGLLASLGPGRGLSFTANPHQPQDRPKVFAGRTGCRRRRSTRIGAWQVSVLGQPFNT
jgi:hypothetical protein